MILVGGGEHRGTEGTEDGKNKHGGTKGTEVHGGYEKNKFTTEVMRTRRFTEDEDKKQIYHGGTKRTEVHGESWKKGLQITQIFKR